MCVCAVRIRSYVCMHMYSLQQIVEGTHGNASGCIKRQSLVFKQCNCLFLFSISESSATEQCTPDIIIKNILKSHQKLEIRNEGPSEIRNSGVWYVDMAGKVLQDITRDGSGSYKNDGSWAWAFKEKSGGGFTRIRAKGRPSKNINSIPKDTIEVVKTYYSRVGDPNDPPVKRFVFYARNYRQMFINNIVGIAYVFHGKEQLLTSKETQ